MLICLVNQAENIWFVKLFATLLAVRSSGWNKYVILDKTLATKILLPPKRLRALSVIWSRIRHKSWGLFCFHTQSSFVLAGCSVRWYRLRNSCKDSFSLLQCLTFVLNEKPSGKLTFSRLWFVLVLEISCMCKNLLSGISFTRVAESFLRRVCFSKFRKGLLKYYMLNLVSNLFKVLRYKYICKQWHRPFKK